MESSNEFGILLIVNLLCAHWERTRGMGELKAPADIGGDLVGPLEGEPVLGGLAEELLEVVAFLVAEQQIGLLVLFAHIVDGDEVGVLAELPTVWDSRMSRERAS